MAKRILILGAGVMQGPALRLARARGLRTVAVDGDAEAPCRDLADQFEHIDLKDKEGIEGFARTLVSSGGLDGIMTAGTDFSASVAWVAERLGLPGIPYEVALNASDKARMRDCFKAASVPSPEFKIYKAIPTEYEILPFAFPVVVKPVDNMGSRGCRRVNGQAELSDAVADALRYSKSGRAIVEEYMDGDEYSVDAIVSNGEVSICGLADRHIFFPPYFIEMGHTIPTAISKADEVELLSVFKAGIAALGITNGAAKGDLKLSSKGPMIGEIAARLSGGYMSGWTYPYASLVEPTAAAIAVALGEKPENLEPKRDWTCAERAFISIPGKVLSISGFEEASSLPFVQNVFMRAQVLARVSFPVNNVSKCGNIIAVAPSRSEASEAAEKAARSILIRLAPEDRETEAFLSAPLLGASAFPPDAFIISPSLKAALDLIPPTKKPSTISQGHIAIIDFPALREANLSDYVGRSLNESLEAVRRLCALDLPLVAEAASPRHALQTLLGREFWQALLRASYQGGAYVVDSLLSKAEQVQ